MEIIIALSQTLALLGLVGIVLTIVICNYKTSINESKLQFLSKMVEKGKEIDFSKLFK